MLAAAHCYLGASMTLFPSVLRSFPRHWVNVVGEEDTRVSPKLRPCMRCTDYTCLMSQVLWQTRCLFILHTFSKQNHCSVRIGQITQTYIKVCVIGYQQHECRVDNQFSFQILRSHDIISWILYIFSWCMFHNDHLL